MKKSDSQSVSFVASSGSKSPVPNVEEMLRGTRPNCQAPADLHDDIMFQVRNAVRQAGPASVFRTSAFHRVMNFWDWLAVSGAAALLLGLAVYLKNPARVPGSGEAALFAASEVLPGQRQIAGELTATAVAPLHEEMDRLEKDISRAAEHLWANIP
jgi:hypothetical protein